jgi:hypothetical protein
LPHQNTFHHLIAPFPTLSGKAWQPNRELKKVSMKSMTYRMFQKNSRRKIVLNEALRNGTASDSSAQDGQMSTTQRGDRARM